jgi:hypothetical protein
MVPIQELRERALDLLDQNTVFPDPQLLIQAAKIYEEIIHQLIAGARASRASSDLNSLEQLYREIASSSSFCGEIYRRVAEWPWNNVSPEDRKVFRRNALRSLIISVLYLVRCGELLIQSGRPEGFKDWTHSLYILAEYVTRYDPSPKWKKFAKNLIRKAEENGAPKYIIWDMEFFYTIISYRETLHNLKSIERRYII